MTDQIQGQLHQALRLAAAALMQATQFAEGRLTPAQVDEITRGLADGSRRLALFVSRDDAQVHAELALIGADVPTVFDNAIVRFDAPMAAVFAEAERVSTVDRGKLN